MSIFLALLSKILTIINQLNYLKWFYKIKTNESIFAIYENWVE